MRTYKVGFGGRPPDTFELFEDFDEALARAEELAIEHCAETGDDPDDIDTWGEDDPEIGAGACPAGCDGGYWPNVVIHDPEHEREVRGY